MRILLIEDDPSIAEVISRGLNTSGYFVKCIGDGDRGLRAALSNRFDLIVLDIMLPSLSGIQICHDLRSARVQTPIIMLTARDDVRDRIRGLEAGADDYLPKPFDFGELLARVKAQLRRERVHRKSKIEIDYLVVDTDQRRVHVAGQEVSLNQREFALLEALAVNEGRVLSRETILDRIWGNEDSYSNLVEVQIRRLRMKTELPGLPRLIHTIHGAGYSLRRPGGEA